MKSAALSIPLDDVVPTCVDATRGKCGAVPRGAVSRQSLKLRGVAQRVEVPSPCARALSAFFKSHVFDEEK